MRSTQQKVEGLRKRKEGEEGCGRRVKRGKEWGVGKGNVGREERDKVKKRTED
jgi:hypothetical protein